MDEKKPDHFLVFLDYICGSGFPKAALKHSIEQSLCSSERVRSHDMNKDGINKRLIGDART
jgi:hypothetical protein